MNDTFKYITILIGLLLSLTSAMAQVRIGETSTNSPTNSSRNGAGIFSNEENKLNKNNIEKTIEQNATSNNDSILPLSPDTLSDNIYYQASDSIVFDIKSNKMYLYNEANLEYSDMKLKAYEIEADWNSKQLSAVQGKDSAGMPSQIPHFEQDDKFFDSEKIVYDFETKQGLIKNAKTIEGEGILYSEAVKRNAEGHLLGANGYYTTCHHEDPHFRIWAKKIKVIPKKLIVSGPANLQIEGLKTPLWLPFAIFPIKQGRRSGIIFPTYGESPGRGFFLRNGGYYFAISQKLDLQIKGDIYSRGSWGVIGIATYHQRYKHQGNVQLSFANNRFGAQYDTQSKWSRSFFIRWNHTQDPKARPGSRFSASVNAGTSNYQRENNVNPSLYLNNAFSSSVSYNKRWIGTPFSLSIAARQDQNTQTKVFNVSLPELAFVVDRIEPFKPKNAITTQPSFFQKIGFSYTLNANNILNTYDTLLWNINSLQRMRNGVQHSLPISASTKIWKYFTLAAQMDYKELWYSSSINKRYTALPTIDTVRGFVSARYYTSSLTLQTRLYGTKQWNAKKIKAIRHVVNPSMGVQYHPNFSKGALNRDFYKNYYNPVLNQNIYYSTLEQGIYGQPPLGKLAALVYSIDQTLEMKVRSDKDTVTGTKKIKLLEGFRISSGYNFAIDTLKMMPWNLSARNTLFDKISINLNAVFDPYIRDNQNRRVNVYEWTANKKISHFQSASLNIGTSLNPKSKASNSFTPVYGADVTFNTLSNNAYVDYSIPWNLSLSYFLQINKGYATQRDTTLYNQILNLNGEINLSPKWKIVGSSGYDFRKKTITYTIIDIYRDLHCWEMRFSIIPFGRNQSYMFTINVKADVLQDLKLTRRRDWYDYR